MLRRRGKLTVPLVLVASVVVAGGSLAGCGTSVGATAQKFQHYVALGDSYAAGPLIPDLEPKLVGCARSTHNYSSDLARAMGIPTFVDMTCSGAVTDDMTEPQKVPLGTNPPQFSGLTPDTDLVTVTIGGNDIGFTSIIMTCAERSALEPLGNPCQQHYTSTGPDRLAAAVNAAAPKVATVLTGIRQHAPHSKIVVVGYLRILPATGGCWPRVPIAAGDVVYLGQIEQDLNGMLATAAKNAGATFVNAGALTGHDSCAAKAQQWVAAVIPNSPGIPIHPTEAGMSEVANLIAAALKPTT